MTTSPGSLTSFHKLLAGVSASDIQAEEYGDPEDFDHDESETDTDDEFHSPSNSAEMQEERSITWADWGVMDDYEHNFAARQYLGQLRDMVEKTRNMNYMTHIESAWWSITVDEFLRVFTGLQATPSSQNVFLNCLATSITSEHHFTGDSLEDKKTVVRKLAQMMNKLAGKNLRLAVTRGGYHKVFVGHSGRQLKGLFSDDILGHVRRSWCWRCLSRYSDPEYWADHRKEYDLAYSGAGHLFSTSPREKACLIHALIETKVDTGVFNTVVCRGILFHSWCEAVKDFYIGRVFDAACLYLLWLCGWCARSYIQPSWITYAALLFTLVRTAVLVATEIAAYLWLYGWKHGIAKWASLWNLFQLLLQIFICWILVHLLRSTYPGEYCRVDGIQKCWMLEHPVQLMTVCGLKWFELIIALLCTDSMGEHVIPAFEAMVSRESMNFICFVLLCVTASFFTYYSLPIKENYLRHGFHIDYQNMTTWEEVVDPHRWRSLIQAFMMIFQVDVMGEQNVDELEGVQTQLTVSKPISSWRRVNDTVATIEASRPNLTYEFGVEALFVFLVVVINLMIMNVYIGILSNIYEEKKKIKHRLHSRFRAHYTCKICLIKMVWQSLWGCKKWGCKKKALLRKGVWIAFSKTVFKDEQSDWREPADIQHDAQADAAEELAPGNLNNVVEADTTTTLLLPRRRSSAVTAQQQ